MPALVHSTQPWKKNSLGCLLQLADCSPEDLSITIVQLIVGKTGTATRNWVGLTPRKECCQVHAGSRNPLKNKRCNWRIMLDSYLVKSVVSKLTIFTFVGHSDGLASHGSRAFIQGVLRNIWRQGDLASIVSVKTSAFPSRMKGYLGEGWANSSNSAGDHCGNESGRSRTGRNKGNGNQSWCCDEGLHVDQSRVDFTDAFEMYRRGKAKGEAEKRTNKVNEWKNQKLGVKERILNEGDVLDSDSKEKSWEDSLIYFHPLELLAYKRLQMLTEWFQPTTRPDSFVLF